MHFFTLYHCFSSFLVRILLISEANTLAVAGLFVITPFKGAFRNYLIISVGSSVPQRINGSGFFSCCVVLGALADRSFAHIIPIATTLRFQHRIRLIAVRIHNIQSQQAVFRIRVGSRFIGTNGLSILVIQGIGIKAILLFRTVLPILSCQVWERILSS